MQKALSIVIKILELLRPKFYNRLTWVIVVAGLGLMSSPIWQDLAKALLERKLEISIGYSNQVAWGFALCCIGLTYHLLSTSIHEVAVSINSKGKKDKILDHDRIIFSDLQNKLDESSLRNTIESLELNHATRHNNSEAIIDFVRSAESASNEFLTPEIKIEVTRLCVAAKGLHRFFIEHFDEYPYGQGSVNFQICLAPQLNCDRAGRWEDGEKYDALASQLFSKTNALMSAYKQWRIVVKEHLYV